VGFARDTLRPRQRALVDDTEIDQELPELFQLAAGTESRIGAPEPYDLERVGFRSTSIGPEGDFLRPDQLLRDWGQQRQKLLP
jgi:hypothetical protein